MSQTVQFAQTTLHEVESQSFPEPLQIQINQSCSKSLQINQITEGANLEQAESELISFENQMYRLLSLSDKACRGCKTYFRCQLRDTNSGRCRNLWIDKRLLPEDKVKAFLKRKQIEVEEVKQTKKENKMAKIQQKIKEKEERQRVRVKVYHVSQPSYLGGLTVQKINSHTLIDRDQCRNFKEDRAAGLCFEVTVSDGTIRSLTRQQLLSENPLLLMQYYSILCQEKGLLSK